MAPNRAAAARAAKKVRQSRAAKLARLRNRTAIRIILTRPQEPERSCGFCFLRV
jgi:hypothetical protein